MALPKHMKRIEEKLDRLIALMGGDQAELIGVTEETEFDAETLRADLMAIKGMTPKICDQVLDILFAPVFAGAETDGEALVNDADPGKDEGGTPTGQPTPPAGATVAGVNDEPKPGDLSVPVDDPTPDGGEDAGGDDAAGGDADPRKDEGGNDGKPKGGRGKAQ